MEQRWTIGIDGSKNAAHALDWAVQHAPAHTQLQAVLAWSFPASSYVLAADPSTAELVSLTRKEVAASAESIVSKAVGDCGASVEALAINGKPARLLLDCSATSDLLVLGTRGLGGFKELLLGSVSRQCVTHAVTPTVIVPESASTGPIQTVLVGMDCSKNAKAALRWALDFAPPSAEIRIHGVWSPPSIAGGFNEGATPDWYEPFETAVNKIVASTQADFPDRAIQGQFSIGSSREILSREAAEADLVVVGARGLGAIGSALLGSTAMFLLHHNPQPTVIVPG